MCRHVVSSVCNFLGSYGAKRWGPLSGCLKSLPSVVMGPKKVREDRRFILFGQSRLHQSTRVDYGRYEISAERVPSEGLQAGSSREITNALFTGQKPTPFFSSQTVTSCTPAKIPYEHRVPHRGVEYLFCFFVA